MRRGHIAQHQSHARLVKIFGIVGRHTHTHGTGPIFDHRQLLPQVRQDGLRFVGVMVGDVEQAQARLACVPRQGHLRAHLRDDQASCHLPLRMRGVAKGKQTHEVGDLRWRLMVRQHPLF